ncbi:MAG: AAA family ATPase [Chlorobium sp.]|uniref:bifunctional aminoglycoside phosphotransferase/ATP-binding protein n=1 Tax=Chlorobium sp. TaxID=1095 RepID=UPI0025C6B17A|nr:bifunctional aminoglycoside phosphotransferase/ATP-binding protein [Chlorobium sp.]MCF8216532.1 AAA family ATPase [Chlorobium sp.]MCF8271437.1 AAA family ATPase [Chlorobium sp.]MCF8287809.1 AAA family ATPase [Chlorobium sp.]MCF8291348.1 AAA family ATPase [Chlorobium sp.]MCF8385443.1 AAA family ATPase [Chlorobium sp.]
MHPLIEALSRADAYPHDTSNAIQVTETHISWVFLTGIYAYKIKKPVNLGFLDFTLLEQRLHYCREEVRLNRRLCPELYLDVVPVTAAEKAIAISGKGRIIDYAVKMMQFDRSLELGRLLADNKLTGTHIDSIIDTVTSFHRVIPAASIDSEYGRPEKLILPLLENFRHTAELVSGSAEQQMLDKLQAWVQKEHRQLINCFLERKRLGFIRHCHGDMHTGNMVWQHDRVLIFDCIEFSHALSMIDVISDIAFLFMDLRHGGQPMLAWRFLNGYLSGTGDYDGILLLRFYSLYRAMVRAKVTAIRYEQEPDEQKKHSIREEHLSYVRQAFLCTIPEGAHLIITCGVSGSGKSTLASELAPVLQAIHIRSDVERKRLAGLDALEKSSQDPQKNIYTSLFTAKTYERLASIASVCLEAGYQVIIDATFLRENERMQFRKLAAKHGSPFTILHLHADEKLLLERINRRLLEGCDPSEADETVLFRQLEKQDPFSEEELLDTLTYDSGTEMNCEWIASAVKNRVN